MDDNLLMERKLFEEAFQKFLDRREAAGAPAGYPLSYELINVAKNGGWDHFIGMMVSDELREVINSLNEWHRYLIDWQAWLEVLKDYEGNDAWSVRLQFVEPLVFACMFHPSSTRDRFGAIATNAVHQGNLRVDSSYKDRLDQDDKRGGHLKRRETEKQLDRIGGRWKKYPVFGQRLRTTDSQEYRKLTRNFRNLASHGIPPRFEIGETGFVRRSVGPWSETVKQPDGSYKMVQVPGRRAVTYGFGGTPPLGLADMRIANGAEFQSARATLLAYEDLVREILAAMDTTRELVGAVPTATASANNVGVAR
jgi:hypothetical protein